MVKMGGLKGLRCLKKHFGAKESESAETQKAKGVLYLLDAEKLSCDGGVEGPAFSSFWPSFCWWI